MNQPKPQSPKQLSADRCPGCWKPTRLCLCDAVQPSSSRTQILILQHPQEPDVELGTAKLIAMNLPEQASLQVGLSWRNLAHALGQPADPSRWGVLYLGSGKKQGEGAAPSNAEVELVSKKGLPLPNSAQALSQLEGVIVLDGTWSQAKALWWRNAWLLKLKRIVLSPKRKSLYGNLRREPRGECLSTLESVSLVLEALKEDPKITQALLASFEELLKRYRTSRAKKT